MINNFINSILKSDDKSKFKYFIITTLSLVFINKISIKPKHIIALFIFFFIIYYIKNKEGDSLNNKNLIQEEKKKAIKPTIDKIKDYEIY